MKPPKPEKLSWMLWTEGLFARFSIITTENADPNEAIEHAAHAFLETVPNAETIKVQRIREDDVIVFEVERSATLKRVSS